MQYAQAKLLDATAGSTSPTGVAANPLQVSLANTATNSTPVKADGSGVTQPVSVASLPLPTGAATAANQSTANSSLASIVTNTGNIPAQGQAVAAASLPVVLPTAQITTLTPPAAITNYAKETGGNLATIATNLPAQGQALAAASMPVVLPASQITTLTPPAAITNYAQETGGNLATVVTNTNKIPSKGQAAMANSTPVAIASDQSAVPVSGTFWQSTQPVSGSVTANAGTNLNTSALALESGGNLATIASNTAANATAANQTNGSQKTQVTVGPNDPTNTTGSITTQDTNSTATSGYQSVSIITGTPSANAAVSATISGKSTVKIQLAGTWTGTITFERSMDGGTTWESTAWHVVGSVYTAGSATGNGIFETSVGAATNVRTRATAAITGTVTANAGTNMSTAALALESGGNLATVASAVSSSKMQANLAQVGGSAVALGQTTMSASVPVALASDQVITDKFASDTTFTITLASLANSSSGVGRQSTLVDNTTNKYVSALVYLSITVGTSPTANTPIYVYLLRSNNDNPIVDDGGGSSDAGITIINAPLLGVINCSATTSNVAYVGIFDTSPLGPLGPKWGIAVVNNTGVALNSTEGNHLKTFIGITKNL